MQKVLNFTLDKKKYVSKPFDFEAFCLINENHIGDEFNGFYRCTIDAVKHMFEGTEATDDILSALDVAKMGTLCKKTWDMYIEALGEIGKNE